MPTKTPGVPKQPKPAKRIRVTIPDGKADFQGKVNIQKALRATAPTAPDAPEKDPEPDPGPGD